MGQVDLFFQSKLYIYAWSYSLKILPKKDKEHLPTISTIILTKENIDFKYIGFFFFTACGVKRRNIYDRERTLS